MQKITIIIPMRNEAKNIKRNMAMYQKFIDSGHQLIIIDDSSEDNSLELLKTMKGLTLLKNQHHDFIGKNGALMTAREHLKYDRLLFLDADVTISDITIFENLNNDYVYSLLPLFVNYKFVEYNSLFFYLLIYLNFYTLNEALLFGGCIYVDKKTYLKIDGHNQVKNSIVEDVDLAKIIIKLKPIKKLPNKYAQVHMYDNYHDLAEGWTKNIFYGSKQITLKSFILSFLMIMFFMYPFLHISTNPLFSLVLYIALTLILYFGGKQFLVKPRFWLICLWPIYYFNFLFIFVFSMFKKKKTWKGREY